MKRALLVCALLLLALLPAHARATEPDFSAFSRRWTTAHGTLVLSLDGWGLFDYNAPGDRAIYLVTLALSSVSGDGGAAYGLVLGTNDPGYVRGGLYDWQRGEPFSLALATVHTAYLQQAGTVLFLCSIGWEDEAPRPPCNA